MTPLMNNLYIAGFTEKMDTLSQTNNNDIFDCEIDDPDNANDDFQVERSSSITIIHEILHSIINITMQNSSSNDTNETKNLPCNPSTIFVLNYKFAHTLSQFIFNSSSVSDDAGIFLCIAPSSMEEKLEIPKKIGNITFAVPQSLRLGNYIVLTIASMSHNDTKKWGVESIEYCQLPLSSEL